VSAGSAVSTSGDRQFSVVAFNATTAPVVVGGEVLSLPSTWDVDIFWDFSTSFVYQTQDFIEDCTLATTAPVTNEPGYLFLLVGAGAEGLGVLAGRSVLELRLPGTYVDHSYKPAQCNQTGPDVLTRAYATPSTTIGGGSGAAVFVTSSSASSGDGLYKINSSWTIQRLVNLNNSRTVFVDETGAYDAQGAQSLYWGSDADLRRFVPATPSTPFVTLTGELFAECSPLSGGDLLCSTASGSTVTSRSLVRFAAASPHTRTVLVNDTTSPFDFYRLIQGRFTGQTTLGYAVLNSNSSPQLKEVFASGTPPTVASTADSSWRWWPGVIPPSTHSLGTTKALYILEGNRVLDIDRVIKFSPP
jgi:hypothetical protein